MIKVFVRSFVQLTTFFSLKPWESRTLSHSPLNPHPPPPTAAPLPSPLPRRQSPPPTVARGSHDSLPLSLSKVLSL